MGEPPRRIAVVTGTRADFGLLTPVMRAIREHPALTLQTVVTGTHLTAGTWTDVRRAGFPLDTCVQMQHADESGRAADAAALGRGVTGLSRTFDRLHPEVVLILGDRIEALAAALAGSVAGFHVAHLHGGDRAEGVADEAMRHAISKLAHLHFPATAQSRDRLIRMGEDERFVWNAGSPAIDEVVRVEPACDPPDLIVLQHPIGDPAGTEQHHMQGTLRAVQPWQQAGRSVRVMSPNQDPGHEGVREAVRNHQPAFSAEKHLPRARFLSLLAGAKAIVGNSSAGLIEAAALRIPCVNIGPRQGGREKPGHVIDCNYGESNVRAAIDRALSLETDRLRHPYGPGRAGERIADHLAGVDLEAGPPRKRNAY